MPNEVLSEKELEALSRSWSLLSKFSVQEIYRKAHVACSSDYGQVPPARAIQELVTAWKLLRKWK